MKNSESDSLELKVEDNPCPICRAKGLLPPCQCGGQRDEQEDSKDQASANLSKGALLKLMTQAHVPAVAYAYVGAKSASEGHFTREVLTLGEKDIDSQEDVSDETQFPASSLSKVVFTYLVLELVSKEHINLDDQLYDELKDKPAYKRLMKDGKYPEKAKQITVEQVLSHTTSLPNVGADWSPDTNKPLEFRDTELGKSYYYSGEAFYFLQLFVESKMKTDLESLAREYVFKPCQMSSRSTFLPQQEKDDVVQVHSELGVVSSINENTPHLNVANAAGSMLTTADDFSKFMESWLKKMDDPDFNRAFVPVAKEGVKQCGLGWHLYGDMAYQYGCNDDTRSFVAINMKTKTASAFFTNSANGMSLANSLFNSPDFPQMGDLSAIYNDLGFSQCDEPGWSETLSGMIAEAKGEFNTARACFVAAYEVAQDDKSKNRLTWFDEVRRAKSAPEKFESDLETFIGTFTNSHNDEIKLNIDCGVLVCEEWGNKTKLIRISETKFLPEVDQSFMLELQEGQMTKHYLDGKSKYLDKSSPEDDLKQQREHDASYQVTNPPSEELHTDEIAPDLAELSRAVASPTAPRLGSFGGFQHKRLRHEPMAVDTSEVEKPEEPIVNITERKSFDI